MIFFKKNHFFFVWKIIYLAGLEQEFFLIPRDAFARRLDLQAHILKSAFFLMTLLQNSKKYIRALNFQNFKMTGRTVKGKPGLRAPSTSMKNGFTSTTCPRSEVRATVEAP